MAIDYKKELESAARNMILVHDPDSLIRMIVRMMVDKAKIAHASFFLYNKEKQGYLLKVSKGSLAKKLPLDLICIDKDDVLIRFFKEHQSSLIFGRDALLYSQAKIALKSAKLKRETAQKQPVVETSRGRGGFESLFEEALENTQRGAKYSCVAGQRISFKLQQYWFEQSKKMADKNISQYVSYEHDTWHKKDPKTHQRHKRKNYYPRVLDKKYSDLPSVITIGERTLITDVEDDEVFTLIVRNKNFTNAFEKLLQIVYDTGNKKR